jgi:uncharacterized membrane protein (UPF0127 family)
VAAERPCAILIVGLLLVTAVAGCDRAETPVLDPPAADNAADAPVETQAVTINGHDFNLELALDDDTRFQGLSDRDHIASDGGMLFVFDRPRRLQFVMRRCLVPIDIVFLDPAGRVTAMHEMQVEPYDRPERQLTRYGSGYPAQFVLEFAGGTLEKLDLAPGDRVELPLAALKARAE